MSEHNQNHFANNLSQFSDNENTAENVNQQIENKASSRLQNEIGSKVLTLVNFESKHKDIVESSFDKARNKKEKLPGKNNERRNFAYLSRLDRMVEKYGDKAEQKLWEASAENLVMDYEDIPEAYWKQQEQILRDNGQGRELSRYEKEILAEDLIEKQRESITSWTNYLGDKNCPYPLWFKVYAFDGISKMSNALNLDDADYSRRDNTTALSFPKLNAEILAKVYRQINNFYGVDKEDWLSKNSDDEKLVSLVKSANFPKLYAKELVDTKVIIKTPERTEDVHGDWFEYKLGDEEEIASLAEGTRWCVVDPNVAHNYLVYGEYGNPEEEDDDYDDEDYDDYEDDNYEDDEDYDEDYEDDDIKVENPEAKFIIFRLEDPNTPGIFASNGSASVRLDPDGKVAEVSGLNEGQAVEDALVPIVKEKTLSLPGGEKYLQKFDDKQSLIRLDKKMEKGEDLTKEELNFLYELDRPIATLDTYNEEDPRIPELKEKYGIEYALEKGVDTNKLVSSLEPIDIARNLDTLLKHGADIDIDQLVSDLGPHYIINNLDIFLDHGADIDIDQLVSDLGTQCVANNLDILFEHGADINNIVNNMERSAIARNLDTLLEHGADININQLVSDLEPYDVAQYLDTLLEHSADINNIVSNMKIYDVAQYLDILLEHGADINNAVDKMESDDIAKHLDFLLENGADINNIVSNMKSCDIADNLDFLLEHGVDIDTNQLVSDLGSHYITRHLDILLEHGADISNTINKMGYSDIAKNLDIFLKHGADINNLVNSMASYDVNKNLGFLFEHGADINNIVNNMGLSYGVDKQRLGFLLEHGADINLVVKKLNKKDIKNNIDLLRKYGANLDMYQENN